MGIKTLPTIHFFQTCRDKPFPRKALCLCSVVIARNFPILQKKDVNIILCSDYRIQRLNATYRHRNKSTDVLSFAFNEEDMLGEIYISLERAWVQARRFQTTYTDEMRRLLIHGILHVLGFDHKKKNERLEMEALEERYLKQCK
jgi:probable rRNA maturation factor